MNDVFVYIIAMDPWVKEHVVSNPDGTYTIFINDYLSPECRLREYNHALSHIQNGDFERNADVDTIEYEAHFASG